MRVSRACHAAVQAPAGGGSLGSSMSVKVSDLAMLFLQASDVYIERVSQDGGVDTVEPMFI